MKEPVWVPWLVQRIATMSSCSTLCRISVTRSGKAARESLMAWRSFSTSSSPDFVCRTYPGARIRSKASTSPLPQAARQASRTNSVRFLSMSSGSCRRGARLGAERGVGAELAGLEEQGLAVCGLHGPDGPDHHEVVADEDRGLHAAVDPGDRVAEARGAERAGGVVDRVELPCSLACQSSAFVDLGPGEHVGGEDLPAADPRPARGGVPDAESDDGWIEGQGTEGPDDEPEVVAVVVDPGDRHHAGGQAPHHLAVVLGADGCCQLAHGSDSRRAEKGGSSAGWRSLAPHPQDDPRSTSGRLVHWMTKASVTPVTRSSVPI